MIRVKEPGDCLSTELEEFVALVRAGREVDDTGLDARIRNASKLLFLTEEGGTKGIAALKRPAQRYRESVFQKAQASVAAKDFSLELGWIFVLPSSRGAGLAHKLVVESLAIA